MKTIQKLFLLLIMALSLTVVGQDITYTFESGSNGGTSDAGATYMNMAPYGTTTLSLIETKTLSGLSATAGVDANTTNVFHGFGVTSTLQTLAVDLTSFTGSNDHQVVWKTYLKTATTITKGIGVILRAQDATSGYGTGARQGYHFCCYGSGTSGSVKFRVGKLDATASYTSLKAETTLPILGFTNGPLYLKAKVIGTKLYFSYSTDGTNYISFPGSPYTDAAYSTGKVQLAWGIGTGSGTDQYYDDVIISDLTKNVSLSGSKFTYSGSAQSPTISTTGFISPTETKTYIGIGGTTYTSSATAPSAVGTYKITVSEDDGIVIRNVSQAFDILPATFDQLYTFNSDNAGSAATNTTASTGSNTQTGGHTVQNFTAALEGGASVETKTLRPASNTRIITQLNNFPNTSTDYSVTWKEFNTAESANKHMIVLRASTTLNNSYFSNTPNYRPQGQGYGFLVNPTGTSAITLQLYKLNTGDTFNSIATINLTPTTQNVPLWFRATATGSSTVSLKFEYSTDGTNWTIATTATDASSPVTSGSTHLFGINGNNMNYGFDYFGYTDLTMNVSLSGSKFIYDGTTKSPTIATTGFLSPTESVTYTGISRTSYGPSSTAPTAAGTYYMTVNELESGVTRTANQVFYIMPATFDKIYTFEGDNIGSAAGLTTVSTGTNVSGGHTVQTFTGATEGGYAISEKTLSIAVGAANTRAISSLNDFGTTSTDYSVTWKEYNTTATANKHMIVLRADPTTNNSTFSPSTNYRPQGQGYGFLVNPTGASALTLQIYKLNTSDVFSSIASVALTPASVQGVPLWFRATATGSVTVSLKFEYSTDGINWTIATTATDASSPIASGATHIFGINSNNQNYYFDYFGFIDLARNVTADDNKFIYTGSSLAPTLSYPGFTSPVATLTYTGTGATSYASSSTAPTVVGTYSLVVSVTENGSGVPRTGTFGFEILPNTFDNIYTFKADGVGNTPSTIVYPQGATSGTGVVASYSGTDNGASATALTFRPTGFGSLNSTGVADLSSFSSSSSYSVTWKEYITANGYKKGLLLQGQVATNGYANDLKQGYLFVVYNDATNGTKCRIYTVTANATLTSTDNANGSVANPAAGVARWYRATVGYGLQKFEYSDNGTTWITANSTSDLTYAGLAGSTQVVYGFGAGVGNYYYDYIASKAYTPIISTGGDWSTISWGSTPNANSNITISSGELVVDQDQAVGSLIIAPGAKLTIASGKTLTADVVNLKSDATGTATLVNNGTATITRATVQQYLTAGRNWYIGSPVTGATAAIFNPGGSLNTGTGTTKLYWYDEANSTTAPWPQITSNNTALVSMRGYVVNLAHDSTIVFSGILNDGTKSITVNRTVGQTKEGFNLITNPYASYLDWDNVTKTNLQTSLWQRTKNGSDTYVFDSYNATGQMAIDNSGRGTNKHVPPMQAFWVRVNSGQATGTLTVNNTQRSHKGNATIGTEEVIPDPMFKVKSVNTTPQSVLRLQVSNGINTDETLLYTNVSAQNSIDAYDSEKMFNNSAFIAELYTLVDGEQLSINGLNNISYDTEIPVGFNANAAGTFTIKASLFRDFAVDTQVILKDSQNQVVTNLSDGNSYTFTSDVSKNNISRFSLIFRSPSITTGIDTNANNGVWLSVNSNNQLIVNGTPLAGTTVDVYNSVGQRVVSKTLNNDARISTITLQNGVYLITINENGHKTTQKIILK